MPGSRLTFLSLSALRAKCTSAHLRLLTKREKAWFFPLCDYQPKINELIFLFFLTKRLVFLLSSEVCQSSAMRIYIITTSNCS
ncbi:hypothetical protein F3J27_18235 [Enterobacter sp. Ap-916]|nr:hypothetical protein [Enterobacter sp. Ap-867]NIG31422.1 hypothetical protein [Enterobacter sp. Ap-916]